MRKKWLGILAVMLCLWSLTGCSSSAGGTVSGDTVKVEEGSVAHSEQPKPAVPEISGAPVTEGAEEVPSATTENSEVSESEETAAENPAEPVVSAPAEIPTEKPAEPVVSAPAEIPAEKPAEPVASAPVEVPAEKPAEPVASAPAEAPAEKPAEPVASTPAETPAEKPAKPVASVPAETPVEKPAVPAEPAKPAENAGVVSGNLVKQNGEAVIDYSNTGDGYVKVQYTEPTEKRLKVQVKGPATTYTYNLRQGEWATFPLSEGDGSYQIKVMRNTTGNKYSLVLSVTHSVTLKDEFAPFIRPNQYVNYTAGSKTVAKATELTGHLSAPLDKVAAVYNYVVNNLTYDKEKAATATSGYLPVLDSVLAAKKGICFDYAALMTGMLRSQGIPCKLVIGYAGQVYHAWISVWTEETGWLDNAIYFDGTTWQRMDPTFASTGNQSAEIMEYIGNNANYSIKYLY